MPIEIRELVIRATVESPVDTEQLKTSTLLSELTGKLMVEQRHYGRLVRFTKN